MLKNGALVGDTEAWVQIPGIARFTLGRTELASLADRFNRRPLLGGPCLLMDRHSGLALDSTLEPADRTRPVLWTVHGLPWQQWRIERTREKLVRIRSEHSGLVLSTDFEAGNLSWVWLEKDRGRPDQLWRLEPTRDKTAFVIETSRSAHALDATTGPRVPASDPSRSVDEPTSPILFDTNAAAWQQWVIARLPLGQTAG